MKNDEELIRKRFIADMQCKYGIHKDYRCVSEDSIKKLRENCMYKSPITIEYSTGNDVVDGMMRTIIDGVDNAVMEAVLNVGITVDKEELVKALEYDRQQYEKGYNDAMVSIALICGEKMR